MNDDQLLRYSRHILLDDIGIEGQQRLRDAHVTVVGAGGLGSPAAIYLAASGIGRLTLVDDDAVDLTNLQRQILHGTPDVGVPKVVSGASALQRLNPDVEVVPLQERLDGERLAALVSTSDVVLDCSDNFATRHAINRGLRRRVGPAGVGRRDPLRRADRHLRPARAAGRVERSPCYACLFPESDEVEEVACSTMGVFAPLTGIVGAMQAAEAAKILVGLPTLSGRLQILDAKTMQWQSITLARDPACPVCGRAH